MARRYSAAEFVTLVQAARSAIPGLAITTDVIVGFPGESDEEFAQSLDCVQGIQFARVHVFPFSPRPGTPAATMPHQVPPSTREKRAAAMRAIGAATEQLFHSQFLGCSVGVLWESRRAGKGGLWSGLTDDYLRVYTASPANLRNRLTMTRLTALALDGLRGEIDE
jgi:threonylcarbamoyladenosine tRNA methylthiotransferase MtaB